ncbi:toll/interleukin-1 receptor domain-containing protein [Candidatus Entotheonella palauensis]|uniref:toll/interleukin-1 receptor domain-containing protein n=1 Tax=Candidatus Entotheonella palauensis TaxID=93172 RepID=UPI000B7CBBEA|nr:toll/interleukin-1 receptor domain-containing protein [Candidatus Entotheonella palauensis]
MSAFVSSTTFQHDVFVSYAHVDNQTYGQDQGWVEQLVGLLRELLPQNLRRGRPDIWFDSRLPGSEPVPVHIREAVTQAATLLVILSKNYFSSEWCQAELELFLDAANQTGADGRIFLVRVDDLEPSQRPKPLQGLIGYEFFIRDEDDQTPYVLGSPMAPNRKLYFRRLDALRRELAGQLLQMKEIEEAKEKQAAVSVPDQPAIFLAEVTPDLEDARDNIRSHLKQMDFRVLPETLYDRSPVAYQTAAADDLARSLVFIQLLGPYVTPKAPDLPKGYEGLQLDIAEAKGLPILRWYHPDLDSASFRDQELLQRADVMVMGFEEFKREVVNTAREQITKQKWDEQKIDDAFILVQDNTPKQNGSKVIQDFLDQQRMFYDTANHEENIEVLVDTYGFHGLIIVYDHGQGQWAKQQLRTCRKLMLQKRQRAPIICVVYTVPPHEEPNLGIRLPQVRHLPVDDRISLAAFLSEVQARAAAS